ncbi:myosin-4-like [Lingula anatina]|uniref:Myosin-4-like n=1 Tax=Lingula anatina TaxID=7574 RepID=A0A1S3HQG1_LINAN|nr:myosin-4-like [Lingula anatina]|eukprot:XP_013388293.1 myosin-4-like [Lingula anatina]
MKEVENYVEHIRSLSEERMSLTTGLENENEQLKAEIEHLKQELETHQNEEVREMLIQQGLDDIAQGSVSEQIAFLLVERARLLDELEAEQSKRNSSGGIGPDNGLNVSQSKLQQMLEQERRDHEEELRQQQESMKQVKEQLRSVQEQELSKVQADKRKVEEQITKARERVKELEKETLKLKGELGKEKLLRAQAEKKAKQSSEVLPTKSGSEEELWKAKQDKSKLERDMLSMKGKVKILEDQKAQLSDQVRILTEDLDKERQQTANKSASEECGLLELNAKVSTQGTQISQLQITQQNLEVEKSALAIKLDSAQKDMENLKKENNELAMENHCLPEH